MKQAKLATLVYLIYNNDEGEDETREIMFLHRTKKEVDFHKDKYIGVGGKLEERETPIECIVREIEEETGYVFTNDELTYRGYLYFDQKQENPKNVSPDAFNWLVFTYVAEVDEKADFVNNEGEIFWFTEDKIPFDKMWDGDRVFTPEIINGDYDRPLEARFLYDEDKVIEYSLY